MIVSASAPRVRKARIDRPSRALTVLEKAVMNRTILALAALDWRGKRACFVSRRHVGFFHPYKHPHEVLEIGQPGECDLFGFTAQQRHFEFELKSATGSLDPDQENWRDVCLSFGILWREIRDPQEAVDAVLEDLEAHA